MTDYLDPFVVNEKFSSPFIEERLYLLYDEDKINNAFVLVPFYRGAVVFGADLSNADLRRAVLVPFYRGAVVFKLLRKWVGKHVPRSRPLLSRSGCIWVREKKYSEELMFSSPFIEERLYLSISKVILPKSDCSRPLLSRSGCIYTRHATPEEIAECSRPLLSRSGCI